MPRSKNVTATGRPARKLFLTAKGDPESPNGRMFQHVLAAMREYGVRNKSEIKWAVILGHKQYGFHATTFYVAVKRRVRTLGTNTYRNAYNIVMLDLARFGTQDYARTLGPSFDTLHRAVNHAETSFMLPHQDFTFNLRASDIPEDV